MRKSIISLLLTIAAITATAQESQTEYNFLRLPVSAHAAALGGDNISIIEDDPTLMFGNPALLASVSDKTLNLNFMTYMDGANTGSASFNRVVNDKASWGVMGQYMNYGSIKPMKIMLRWERSRLRRLHLPECSAIRLPKISWEVLPHDGLHPI